MKIMKLCVMASEDHDIPNVVIDMTRSRQGHDKVTR